MVSLAGVLAACADVLAVKAWFAVTAEVPMARITAPAPTNTASKDLRERNRMPLRYGHGKSEKPSESMLRRFGRVTR